MSDIEVFCDSINNCVVFSSCGNVLSTFLWKLRKDDGVTGFIVQNSKSLIDVYSDGFYILDHTAVLQFIINASDKIAKDLMKNIVYLNSNKEVKKYPLFIPNTVMDEEIDSLPDSQLHMCDIWKLLQDKFNGFLCEEFLDSIPPHLKMGFIDLINIELGKKGDDFHE